MRSPIEHEPELLEGIGLITTRWAALERGLSSLLGLMMIQSTVGDRIYYTLGNFSQRIEVVQAAAQGSMGNPQHIALSEALFGKIKRLWKSRNYLVHGHYVYLIRYKDGGFTVLNHVDDKAHTFHPHTMSSHPIRIRGEVLPAVDGRSFAYRKLGKTGSFDYIPVNGGTFRNHAQQLLKRSRQLSRFAHAIEAQRTPIIASHTAISLTSKYRTPQ